MVAAIVWVDWVVLALSVVLVILAGTWFARRQKSTEQYFVGGRSMPGWAAGLSLFASSISTITFLAYPGQGYGGDWTLLLPGFMLPIVILFISRVIVPVYRQVVRMSAYEYLEQRFGYLARVYAASLFLMVNLFRMGFVLFLASKAIHTLTHWDIVWLIVVSGAITILYTVLGGIEAVIWTDVVQSFILLGGGIFCAILLLTLPEDGAARALELAYESGKFRLADVSLGLTRPTLLVMILYGLFSYASAYSTTQDSVQRYLVSPTTRQARRGLWMGTLSCVVTWTLFMFIGTLLWSYYTLHPGEIPAGVAGEQEKVFPHFVMTKFPAGTVGLVLAAMVAAAMSTLSTVINSMSMVTMCDFLGRLRPPISERRQLVLSKLTACMWGVVGTSLAVAMIQVERALHFSYIVGSILSGGLLGVFMLAFLVRRASAPGVYVGLLAGVLMTTWGTLPELAKLGLPLPQALQSLRFPFHTFMLIVCSNLASFGIGWLACLVLPPRPGAVNGRTIWDLRSDDV